MNAKERNADSPARLSNRNRAAMRAARQTLALLAGILCLSLPSFANQDIFQKTYALQPGGCLLLENVNGSVHVDGWDRDEVEVYAVKTAENDPRDTDQVQIEVESHPGQVVVHTRYPKGTGAEVAVEYHVHVPYRVLLGNIKTVNGSVLVRGVKGGGDLHSVNGNVEVTNSSGRFNARTTNGDLHLELRQVLDGAPMNLETVNGSVELGLPSDAHGNLKVLEMNGDFYSELPVTPSLGPQASRSFHAKLGEGGGDISVRTVNGAIRLVREHPGV